MKLRLIDIPIYVTHYTKLAERRMRLERDLARRGLCAKWLTSNDREDLTPDALTRCCDENEQNWRRKTEFYTTEVPRKLKSSEVSLALKHLDFYARVASGSSEYALVLEDDAILSHDFGERFDEYFADAPADLDLIFIGSGCNLRVANASNGRYFYEKSAPATKCTDSYVVSRRAASKLSSTLLPLTLPIDFELNYQIHAQRLKVYWLEPPIVVQGSQNGMYRSAIQ